MEFTDKTLKCAECSQDFTFTANEQQFYQEKGFANEPKRCPTCRQSRRHQRRGGYGNSRGGGYGGGGYSQERTRSEIVCASCGQKSEVPFKPVQNRPVYCNACFAKMKESADKV